jgi:hypothetical protein
MTYLGPLDALGAIEGGADYDELVPESLALKLGGRLVYVLSLAKIVALKRASSDGKDKLRLAILEAVLQRRERGT